VLALAVTALFGEGRTAEALRDGFTGLSGSGNAWAQLLVGVTSQGTGIFGALILLDGRENSFCVPVNRASSILAGVVATAGLGLVFGGAPLDGRELAGATVVLLAMTLLAWPSVQHGLRTWRHRPAVSATHGG
jgi:hypothetical protein